MRPFISKTVNLVMVTSLLLILNTSVVKLAQADTPPAPPRDTAVWGVGQAVYVESRFPTTVTNGQQNFYIGQDNLNGVNNKGFTRLYYQPQWYGFPAGSQITSAVIYLYQYARSCSSNYTVDIYELTGGWSAGSVNWNNQPAKGNKIGSTVVTCSSGWKAFNITSLAQSWLAGTKANNGVTLWANPESSLGGAYRSHTCSITQCPGQEHPYLQVDYTVPPTTYSVSGRVVNSGGTGISGTSVTATGGQNATTDGNGNYTITGLTAGNYTLTPSKYGYSFSPPSINVPSLSSNVSNQNFTATPWPTYYIAGRIVDSRGYPLSGISVSGGGQTVSTDGSGNYRINGLYAGNYTITPANANYTFSPASRTLTINSNTSGQDFTASVSPSNLSISGRVTLNGAALGNVLVSAGSGRTATTDMNGYYKISGLRGGNYTLIPSKSGYTFSPVSRSLFISANAVGQDFAATRVPNCYTLMVTPPSNGRIEILTSRNCANGYLEGSIVTIRARPNSGYRFTGWNTPFAIWPWTETANLPVFSNITLAAGFELIPPKPVIVLVHGWHGLDLAGTNCTSTPAHVQLPNIPKNDFGAYPRLLAQEDFDVWVAYLQTSAFWTPSIFYNALCLKNQLKYIYDYTHVRNVTIISHSMGGRVSRLYLEGKLGAVPVSKLFTLGTPHAGTPLAQFACLYGHWQTAACEFLLPAFGQRPANVDYTFIGGTKTPAGTGPILDWILGQGPNDGVVGAASALGRMYDPLQRRATYGVINPSRRYQTNESHSPLVFLNTPEVCFAIKVKVGIFEYTRIVCVKAITIGDWHPSYFNQSINDNTSKTQSFQCINSILGKGGYCPSPRGPEEGVAAVTSTGMNQLPSVSGVLLPNQTTAITVPVDYAGKGQFTFAWQTGTAAVSITTPSGLVVTPEYANANPADVAYEFSQGDGADLFSSATYAFTTTTPGIYTMTVQTGNDIPVSGSLYGLLNFVESPRTLYVAPDTTPHSPGDTLVISATLQNNGVGMDGAQVQASFVQSGTLSQTINLIGQGNGLYAAPYVVPEIAGNIGTTYIATGTDQGLTYARQVDAFMRVMSSTVRLTEEYSDSPIDADENGKYEALQVSVGVTVTKPGSYLVSGRLVDVNAAFVASGLISVTLPAGPSRVLLPFDGDSLRASQLNGPYTVTDITIEENEGPISIWEAQVVWVTDSYTWTDFATTCYTLSVNQVVGGQTTIAGASPNCNNGLQYTSDSVLTLTVQPEAGYTFLGWGEDGIGLTDNPLTLTMTNDWILAPIIQQPTIYFPFISQ